MRTCRYLKNSHAETRRRGECIITIRHHYFVRLLTPLALFILLLAPQFPAAAAAWNGFGQQWYTIETDHFRIHYHAGIEPIAKRVGDIAEKLYSIYRETYLLKLPSKTDVIVSDNDESNGWAASSFNMMHIWTNTFDFNLRGSSDWLEDVVAHEYAHIVSIWLSQKLPSWMPFMQLGYFSHPNDTHMTKSNGPIGLRVEAHRLIPHDILPPWYFEGIAQYEATRNGTDRWDTHRDMLLRTMILSGTQLSWDHLSVFSGRADDFEKTYNQGFSMIKYISERYGYEKIPALAQRSEKLLRFNFDRSIEDVLGKTGRALYDEWRLAIKKNYVRQIEAIGAQVYGRKITKDGFENFKPRFSADETKIYFLSNGKRDSFRRSLLSYSTADTILDDKRIKPEILGVGMDYDILDSADTITYISQHPFKSQSAHNQGGDMRNDVFTCPLPNDSDNIFESLRKKERQVSFAQSIFHTSFSPSGNRLAISKRINDRYYLCLTDTTPKKPIRFLYPQKNDSLHAIATIFSLDWSPDGHRIAVCFLDRHDNKIGIYDTLDRSFSLLCDTEHDERDPRFSPDGGSLYFSSDRSGIFNIYRYIFSDRKLQRVTNVSGGAFTPDVSHDGKRLVYANYDDKGYGIYLLDSIKALQEWLVDSAFTVPARFAQKKTEALFTAPQAYSYLPRKAMVIPSLFMEEAITEDNDPFTGRKSVKVGGVINLFDPLAFEDRGNEFGAYLLGQPGGFHKIIAPDQGFFGREVDYDFGVYGTSRLLPVTIEASADRRGISGRDLFFDGGIDSMLSLAYNISPRDYELIVSHEFLGSKFSLRAAYNIYEYYIFLPDIARSSFSFNPIEGYRFSAFLTNITQRYRRTNDISPKGLYAKLLYNFYSQNLYNSDRGFIIQDNVEKPLYDKFYFHELTGSLKFGMATPWFKKHDLYLEFKGTTTRLTEACKKGLRKNNVAEQLPAYYKPAAWIPGYTYFYRDTLANPQPGDPPAFDTVLVSGNTLFQGMFSYRFPLWPGSIDKKMGWIYLNNLFGALNFYYGAGFDNPTAILPLKREDWLLAVGGEIRLDASSFGGYPLFVNLKYDYGLDRPAPIGGVHLMLGIGLSFDKWEYIDIPDYHRKPADEGLQPRLTGLLKR
jgi:hypothetical protein